MRLTRRSFLARASVAGLALLVPNARILLVLLVVAAAYGPAVQAAVGFAGSIIGIVTVLATGFIIVTVRTCTPTLTPDGRPTDESSRLYGRQLSLSLLVGVLLLGIVGVIVLAAGVFSVGPLSGAYLAAAALAVAFAPALFVLNAGFQTIHRDSGNLVVACVGTAVHVSVAFIVGAVGVSDFAAVTLMGGISSLTAVFGLVARSWQLHRSGLLTVDAVRRGAADIARSPRSTSRILVEVATASLDGVVFMTVFATTIAVALHSSVAAGAQMALAVAVMRTIIIPMKQFGIVGARFTLRARALPSQFAFRDVAIATEAVLVASVAILVVSRIVLPAVQTLSWLLIALMAAQLLLEPFAGVAYAYRRIVDGPSAGLAALLIAYGGLYPVLILTLVAVGGAQAEALWAALLASRILFVILLTRSKAGRRLQPLPVR
ncbi:hypothetical protein AB1K56_12810 [Microbacterium sp. BWR-S6Y]|uniref:hypothetical protein n=1 Tax=Microbacterium sp. BWR-S6Y TaxID=3232073 RepID=UPI0035296CF5